MLLARGEVSNILLAGTVARMQAMRPDMQVVTLPGIGHAPILTEPPILSALHAFLERHRMRLARFIAAGFGTGDAPMAPGTVASAAAVLAAPALLLVSPLGVALAALLATVGGFVAVRRADVHGDPGWVVIDEFAGQWITMLALARPSCPVCLPRSCCSGCSTSPSLGRSAGRTASTALSGSWLTTSLPDIIGALILASARFGLPDLIL